MATLVSVSNHGTTVIMTYEERDTGNKPEIEKRFFIVSVLFVHMYVEKA